MRSLIAVVALAALSAAAPAGADSPVADIDFRWREGRNGSPVDDPVVYVGYEETFTAWPVAADGLPVPAKIRVDAPVQVLFEDFIGPAYADRAQGYIFTVKPTYAFGPRTEDIRFEVSHPGRVDVLHATSFYFEVRHCLNGTWEDLGGLRTLEICQSGDTVRATVRSGPLLCGQETLAFTATLDGEILTGDMTACAPDWCLRPKATRETVPRVFRDRPFEATVSKKGDVITGDFRDIHFTRMFSKRMEDSWCETDEPETAPVSVQFHRIEQFGQYAPRCGAACPGSEELPAVTVPGIE